MKNSLALALLCGWFGLTGYGATYYADRTRPDDSGDGKTWATAKRTLQAAVDIANTSDTVLVAPGIYDEGLRVTPGGWLSNRVVLTKDILLESTHGAKATVIMGARDPADATFQGCGSNAVRCVYATAGTIRGFTLAGGASGSVNSEDLNNRGGGLYSPSMTGLPILHDCNVSNNAAIRGGGAYGGTFHRCLVSGNFAQKNGGGVRETILHDSLIVFNAGGGANSCYSNPTGRASGVYNCTVARNAGTGLEQSSGFNTISVENGSAFTATYPTVTYKNCCLSSATSLGTNNIVAASAGFVDAANGDFRLMPSSPCLDIADPALNGNALPAGQRTDYFGNPRVQGAGLDLGAIEGAAENTATVTCVAPTGSGTLSPLGHVALYTLPTQRVFTATAGAGYALRYFTVNGARMMECGNTFTMKVTQPKTHTVSAVFITARYVDAESGSDANDGTAPANAWRTLQYAADTAPAGSMVLAAPGFYDEGGAFAFELSNRVYISRNVVLKGSGAGQSFIMGAPDPEGDAFGCGSNAVRCVSMLAGAVEGFTVTGGRASNLGTGSDWRNRGGGFVVNGFTAAQIWDCVISNNVATRGGAMFGGIFHRCRIEENRATVYGVNRYGTCYDCLLARNTGWATGEGAKLYNCTVTANDRGINQFATEYVRNFVNNCIVFGNTLGDVAAGTGVYVTNSCTGGALQPGAGNISANPLFVDAANGDYRLRADSPCKDTGNVVFSFEPEGTDLAGAPRVIGPQVNMGAFESCVGVINAVAANGSTLSPSGAFLFESFPTSVTFTVTSPPGRTFLHFLTNGVPVPYTGNTITLSVLTPETGIQLQAFFEGTFYADPSRPDDSGDGASWATAKRTLQAAVDLAFDGETVLAAPGVYSEGTRPTPREQTVNGYLSNRVLITNNIALRSRDGAANTVILGAFDTASGDSYGRGPNAVRGVYMNKGVLQGFTITGGATGNEGLEDENNRGGGVYVPYDVLVPWVLDCVISNNAAFRGGGSYFGTFKRCRILGNYASVNGAGMRNGFAHNCLIAGNRGASAAAYATLYHCTVAGNDSTGLSDYTLAYNSISSQNGGVQVSANAVCTNCCSDALAPGYGNIAADPLFANAAAGNYRLSAGSPCLERANPAYVEELFGADLDGAMRTLNGIPDLGAYEWDWRPAFAADLDGSGLTVTEVTPFVTHVTNAAYTGGSAVYLDGTAASAYGQETLELALLWSLTAANTVYLSFQVDGLGTLTLYEDAVPIASAVLADGYQTLKYGVRAKPCNLRAVYTVAEGDTGGALLDAFDSGGGFMLLLR